MKVNTLYCCIAYPCTVERVKNDDGTDSSAFCKEHQKIHSKSVESGWVLRFHKLMKDKS